MRDFNPILQYAPDFLSQFLRNTAIVLYWTMQQSFVRFIFEVNQYLHCLMGILPHHAVQAVSLSSF